ncbi:OmpA family protein [Allohahella marinimesophila]|uniref:OmpA family protein n=1 Tax=Allohahella marinimesophila TaxID=1054972 RepID=A0ABP7PJH5_9GAMM
MSNHMRTISRHWSGLAGLAMTAALASASWADTADTVHLGTQPISSEEVIRLLAPEKMPVLLTRGLRVHERDAEEKYSGTELPEVPVAKSLSMEVYFEFNSVELTPEAIKQLFPVGGALESDQLANLEFTLEGHTDAIGDEAYNLQLSEQRAASVRRFFLEQFELSFTRIRAEGRGESQLIEGAPPASGVNRRVTIIAQ